MRKFTKGAGAIIGLIILFIPTTLYLLWIHACNQTNGYPENVNLYKSYFPALLSGRFTTTILSFVLCVVAVSLNGRNLDNKNKFLRGISWFVVIVGGLLGFLYLFSMM